MAIEFRCVPAPVNIPSWASSTFAARCETAMLTAAGQNDQPKNGEKVRIDPHAGDRTQRRSAGFPPQNGAMVGPDRDPDGQCRNPIWK